MPQELCACNLQDKDYVEGGNHSGIVNNSTEELQTRPNAYLLIDYVALSPCYNGHFTTANFASDPD